MRDDAVSVDPHNITVAMVIQRFRPNFSGQGIQLELLCKKLALKGVRSTIIASAYSDASNEEFLDGYRIVRLRTVMSQDSNNGFAKFTRDQIFSMRAFSWLLRQHSIDLVHVHATTNALYSSWLACRLQQRPLIFEMTLLNVDDPVTIMQKRGYLSVLRRTLFRRCDGYVAISPSLAQRCKEANIPDEKVRVLAQGVDCDEFKPISDDGAVRQELGIPLGVPVIMFVGSLIHRKGIDLLLRAWSEIHAIYPDAHLILVGKNCFEEDLHAARFLATQVSHLPTSAAACIHQLGVREDVNRLLAVANVFVFPSRSEGFGTVMIEAMSCGVPCVVSSLPGITDFIFGDNSSGGKIVPQEDHRALVDAVNDLLADPQQAFSIGMRGRDRAIANFSIDRIVDGYVEYYNSLVAKLKID